MAVIRQSERVRSIVADRYVRPAVLAGQKQFSIPARDVLRDAEATEGFPRGRTPTICAVLQSKKLLDAHGLEIERVDGPKSKESRTVVVHYRVREGYANDAGSEQGQDAPETEDAKAWAARMTGKLRGLLKEEIAAYGGAEAFMKWVRSDGEEEA